MSNNKVGFVSLGCPKTLVDSERILNQLKMDGLVHLPGATALQAGDFIEARITGADEYDLFVE